MVDPGAGGRPSIGLATATTDSAGRYNFSGLNSGTCCVPVDILGYGNLAHLVPGGWRVPSTMATAAGYTIALMSEQDKSGVDFLWLFQFGEWRLCPRALGSRFDASIRARRALAQRKLAHRGRALPFAGACGLGQVTNPPGPMAQEQ